jgi:signal transduction histidine kinase/CHASE1-domain containing sensor protein
MVGSLPYGKQSVRIVELSEDAERGLRGTNLSSESSDDDDKRSAEGSVSVLSLLNFRSHSTRVLMTLIMVLGIVTSAAFVSIGVSSALQEGSDEFERGALDTIHKINDAFEDYVHAASLIHGRCRHREFSRADFREFYEYLIDTGLRFKAVQFDPNITHAERPDAEAEARAYYAENHPQVDYQGFRGFNYANSTSLEPRTNQSFYFPIHYQEPIPGNEAAIDLDYHSSESRTRAVYSLFENRAPSMTDRLSLVKQAGQVSRCGNHGGPSYGVVLMHPGVELTTDPDVWPRDFSSIVLCIPDVLTRATSNQSMSSSVYIHDRSHPSGEPVFLGAARITQKKGQATGITFLDELELSEMEHFKVTQQEDVGAANRVWTITVVNEEGRYSSNLLFVTLGGCVVLFASIFLALWVRNNDRRTRIFNDMQAVADQEKATLILSNARQATKTERELNDFIAHEVRNPVAAAMAACNFVKVAVNKENPLNDEESKNLAREDVTTIDNALHFVNDLLRNMLDMHRAASKQLEVTMAPTDLLHDVLEPVGGMLYSRGSKVEMIIQCPDDLYVITDRLRLKQVILNLGRNSTKFVEAGYIRLTAEKVDGSVKIYVDDSGSGIPKDKQKRLFAKFQESLDVLSQGTVSISLATYTLLCV